MKITSLRPFIGAKDFSISRAFYSALGFTEKVLQPKFSVFTYGNFHFYLQDAYVKDWIENSQVFLEVEDLAEVHRQFSSLGLEQKFPGVRLSAIKRDTWGSEFFLHDPAGVLWHIGSFK